MLSLQPAARGAVDELLKMLNKIDEEKLNRDEKTIYQFALSKLQPESKVFGFDLDAAIEGYVHTNKEDFTREEQWIRGYNERKPLIGVALETWPTKNLYGYSEITIQSGFDLDAAIEGYVHTNKEGLHPRRAVDKGVQ
ncbi:MAG: hypothetical protein ACOXZ2_05870 [Sphaerochaetaceae bacterium]